MVCIRILPEKLVQDIAAWCDPFLKVVDDIEGLLSNNRIFKQRNVDIGVFNLQDAQEWGLTGVMLRSVGRGVGFAQVAAL